MNISLPQFFDTISQISSTTNTDTLFITSSEEEAINYAKQLSFFVSDREVLYLPALDSLPYDRVSPNQKVISARAYVLSKLASRASFNRHCEERSNPGLNPASLQEYLELVSSRNVGPGLPRPQGARNDDSSFTEENIILITSVPNLLCKFPDIEKNNSKFSEIKVGQELKSKDFEAYLINIGYERSPVAVDSGEFSKRGDILDIVTFGGEGYRINLEWDKVDKIKLFDPVTQISNKTIDKIDIFMASELRLNEVTIENFRNAYLTNFGISKMNEDVFEKICAGIKVNGIENIAPIFYENPASILSYLNSPKIFTSNHVNEALNQYKEEIDDFYQARISGKTFYPAFKPDNLYYSLEDAKKTIDNSVLVAYGNDDYTPNFYFNSLRDEVQGKELNPGLEVVIPGLTRNPEDIKTGRRIESGMTSQKTSLQLFVDFISDYKAKKIIIACSSLSSRERLKVLLQQNEASFNDIENVIKAKKLTVNLAILPISKGFITPNIIIVPDNEIVGEKKYAPQSSKKRLENIFKELENFAQTDLVVHKDHGIGMYDGIEQIDVENIRHDCLKIIYAKGDKLFIPVENIDLIKKYGDGDTELDTLGSSGWQRRKAKLKDRIGEIANGLLELAAKRNLIKIPHIEYDIEAYNKFCDHFEYVETEDQMRAFADVFEDLNQDKPMDRLICGDVGFGKTEVAMRAAFLLSSKKQVAIIVPTTILAQQHYNNFIERFKGFNTKIAHLSRFVSTKDASAIKSRLQNGEVDIIIGTHTLLSDNIKFHNLGLIVIDEEQHFGVLQKEKLKKISTGVHTLTLSATPIPRTLQMSLIGVKDLSLIATPPIDRLAVKTNVIEFDEVIIKDALLKEKFRGGKSFFVAPRVADLEELSSKLKHIVPELSVRVAHGQLGISEIDQIMSDFYEGKFDVLLSTAIVESGLDVPSANTMIIFKGEMFGLSQLYQLRGRVGRGKIRGYTYIVTNPKKLPTKSAIKRLEIMQTIDSLGAGFSIASHDMDLRGFGNMVGDEQSGHIREVGVELYQEMLEEAMSRLKNADIDYEVKDMGEKPEIKMSVPVYIPDEYIKDVSLRLSIYRRAGDIINLDELESFKDELVDRFGKIPESVMNLLEIISLKIRCKNLGVKSLDSGSGGFTVRFYENVEPEKIISFVSKHPRNAKIKPDNKLVFMKPLKPELILYEAREFVHLLGGFL